MVRDGMHSVRVGDGLKSFAVRRFAPGVLRTCSDGKCENVYGSNLKSPRNSTDNRNDYEQVSYWVKPPSRASSVRGTAFFLPGLERPVWGAFDMRSERRLRLPREEPSCRTETSVTSLPAKAPSLSCDR